MKTLMFMLGAGFASAFMIISMKNRIADKLNMADTSSDASNGTSKIQSSAVQRAGSPDMHSAAAKKTRKSTKESTTGNVD